MSEQSQPFIVGRIGRPHGIRGWMRVNSFTDPITNIMDYGPWLLEKGNGFESGKKIRMALKGEGIILHIEGCDTPEDARLYTNRRIAILRSQLGELEEDEYYWADLEGLSVVNQQGIILGQVERLIESGNHPLLVVKGERERLIPFVYGQFVMSVDLAQRQITVDWDAEF